MTEKHDRQGFRELPNQATYRKQCGTQPGTGITIPPLTPKGGYHGTPLGGYHRTPFKEISNKGYFKKRDMPVGTGSPSFFPLEGTRMTTELKRFQKQMKQLGQWHAAAYAILAEKEAKREAEEQKEIDYDELIEGSLDFTP
jgi:hypothetical protein